MLDRKRWPCVSEERRSVIASRTEGGGACTLVVVRAEDGSLRLYFHGARQTSADLCRDEAAALIEALRAASA